MKKVVLILYSIATLIVFCVGMLYLFKNSFMPYHEQAYGKTWEDIDLNEQILFLSSMKVAGGGFIGVSLFTFALFRPFLKDETWAIFCIPLIGIAASIPSLIGSLMVKVYLNANSPWYIVLFVIILYLLGFMLSLVKYRNLNYNIK